MGSLIQQELNSKDSTIREKEEEVIELKRNLSMKGSRSDSDAKEISKLQTEIQTLNLKLMDLVEEVQIAKDKYFELENSSKAQLAKLVVEDTSRLNEENEKKSEEIVLLSNKLMFSQKKSNSLAKDHRENLAFFANLQKETDSLTKEKEILTITCADHNAAIKNLHKELADFQTRSDTEKKRMLELIAIKSVVEERLQVMENVKQLSEEKDDEIEKLQGQITNLEVQSNELNRKIRIIVKRNKDLESTNSKQRGNLEKIDENLFEKENEIIRIETEFKLTRNELEELNIESEDVILKWQELESSMNEQEVKLGKQQEDASNAILQWESRCKLLEERLIDETKHLNDNVGELSEVLKLKDSSLHNLEEQIKINIAEVLRLNNEHITHVQQMQEILDERDEHVKELLAAGEQSEKVVLQWQDNSQQLEVTVTDLEKTIESQNDEADIAISQWETRCSTFSSQLEETEQGLNDKLQKIEQLEQQLTEKDCKLSTANAETSENELKVGKDTVLKIGPVLEKNQYEDSAKNKLISSIEEANLKLTSKLKLTKQSLNDMKLQIECESQESAYKLKIVNEGKESINDSYNKLTIEADEMKITIKKLETETQEVNIVIECERQESAHKLKLLNETKEKIKCSYGKLKTEAHEMRIIIGKLENEAH